MPGPSTIATTQLARLIGTPDSALRGDDKCGCDGARSAAGDFADASLDASSIAFVLDCHVWSNDKVRVTARNVSLSTVDFPAAALHVQLVKRRVR